MATPHRREYMKHYMRAYRARQAQLRRNAPTVHPFDITVDLLRDMLRAVLDNVAGLTPAGRQKMQQLLQRLEGHRND